MDWKQIGTEPATAAQRQAIYRFIAGVDADDVKSLIRLMTSSEAGTVLAAFKAADDRRVTALIQTQHRAAEGPQQAVEPTPVQQVSDPVIDDVMLGRAMDQIAANDR